MVESGSIFRVDLNGKHRIISALDLDGHGVGQLAVDKFAESINSAGTADAPFINDSGASVESHCRELNSADFAALLEFAIVRSENIESVRVVSVVADGIDKQLGFAVFIDVILDDPDFKISPDVRILPADLLRKVPEFAISGTAEVPVCGKTVAGNHFQQLSLQRAAGSFSDFLPERTLPVMIPVTASRVTTARQTIFFPKDVINSSCEC